MAKPFARQFYSSKTWQECRNEYARKQHHLCERCLKKGIYKPGVIVHHVEELTPLNIHRPEIALNFDNLELVCRECHAEIHDQHGRWAKVNEKKRQARDAANRYRINPDGTVTSK